ncbi:MAG: hypothetical protein M3346_00330 [Actinomycetota bacterium]|nr:hypothetical protein [Actinomycetota bacterium]
MVTRVLQVKFGECWLYDYRLGDSVRWASGHRRRINHGTPFEGRAWIAAYAEGACPSCNADSDFAEFAVVMHGDQFIGIVQAPVGFSFAEDLQAVPLNDDDLPPWRPDPSG